MSKMDKRENIILVRRKMPRPVKELTDVSQIASEPLTFEKGQLSSACTRKFSDARM